MSYVRKIIKYRSPMQIEKSQPEGKRIMPETRKAHFRHDPLTRGLGFLGLHWRPMVESIYLKH